MLPSRVFAVALVAIAGILTANLAYAQDPADVRAALGVLNRVVGHTQRLITAKNYTRLPHEDGELKEGVEALEKAIANESAEFKHKVEPLIKQAEDRSHALAAASGNADSATLDSAHDALARAVESLVDAFPASERPTAIAPAAPDRK